MNYSAIIQNRKSVREFSDKQVPHSVLTELKNYYKSSAHRLLPQLETELLFFGPESGAALEGAAGYNRFLIGAPQYMVLLAGHHDLALLNAGYLMQDLLLNLEDMGLNSCWVTFHDSDEIKQALEIHSNLNVAAIAAFGYGLKTTKRLRLNFKSMSNVDVVAKHRYMDPKRSIHDMVFLNTWGNTRNVDTHIGFFDDMLWESFYAASLAPSYLNRQAYGFVIHEGGISLVARPDSYNTPIDGQLSLGIVMLHFSAVAENWAGRLNWSFAPVRLDLPEGHQVVATLVL